MKTTEYMTVADIRDHLNISLGAAYRLTHRNDFPVCHFGGAIRIPRSAFLVWVEKMTSIPGEISMRMQAV